MSYEIRRSSYGTWQVIETGSRGRQRVYETTNKTRAEGVREALEHGVVVPVQA